MTTRREFIQSLPAAGAAFAVVRHVMLEENAAMAGQAATAEGHFHPKGKPPSKHTLEVLRKAKAALPFHDRRDFEENENLFSLSASNISERHRQSNDQLGISH